MALTKTDRQEIAAIVAAALSVTQPAPNGNIAKAKEQTSVPKGGKLKPTVKLMLSGGQLTIPPGSLVTISDVNREGTPAKSGNGNWLSQAKQKGYTFIEDFVPGKTIGYILHVMRFPERESKA